ncbi:hypothetical protein ACI1TC_08485 [Lactococcus petauri]|jgi:hypothetical protein|uniref:hypothetical protein n=1 Tax=Lactococcus petauri TaxID=1940789 RepID=UPI00385391A9
MKFKKTEVFYEPQLLSWLIKLNIGDKKIPLFEIIFGIERGVVINPMKRPRFKYHLAKGGRK